MKPGTRAGIVGFGIGSVIASPWSASMAAQQGVTVSRDADRTPSAGPNENFTGGVKVVRLFDAGDGLASGASVAFEAGARSAWHSHPRGQVLLVTAGVGRVQARGGRVEEIRPGDVVRIPPGQKHWHGASPDAAMTHLAIQEHANGVVVDWMEHVSDAQYRVAPTARTISPGR